MPRLLALLVSMLCLHLTVGAPPPKKQILEGFVEGFLSDRPDLKGCVSEGADTIGDLEQALKDILKKDLPDAASGLRKLADALDALPVAMRECKATEGDVKDIIHVLEEFKGLKNFTIHVLGDVVTNIKDIVTEFGGSYSAFKANNYEECGRQLGMAFHRIVIGKEGPAPSPPGPTPPGPASAMCKNHPGCSDLHPVDGLCCPVADGTRLACCDQETSIKMPWEINV